MNINEYINEALDMVEYTPLEPKPLPKEDLDVAITGFGRLESGYLLVGAGDDARLYIRRASWNQKLYEVILMGQVCQYRAVRGKCTFDLLSIDDAMLIASALNRERLHGCFFPGEEALMVRSETLILPDSDPKLLAEVIDCYVVNISFALALVGRWRKE